MKIMTPYYYYYYYHITGPTRPYACLAGDSKEGCSDKEADWLGLSYLSGLCTK